MFAMTFLVKLVLLGLCFAKFKEQSMMSKEVDAGKMAVLKCPSIDYDHNFLFWKLAGPVEVIIGPGNPYNDTKYEYEVLSGKLFIKSVTTEEAGVYICASQGVRHSGISMKTVKMIVKDEWKTVDETDSIVNFLRILIVIFIIIVLLGGIFLVNKRWKKKRLYNPPYLDPLDDDELDDDANNAINNQNSKL